VYLISYANCLMSYDDAPAQKPTNHRANEIQQSHDTHAVTSLSKQWEMDANKPSIDGRRLPLSLREQSAAMQGLPEPSCCEPRALRLQRYLTFSGILGCNKGRGHTDERRGMPCFDGIAQQKLRLNVASAPVRMARRRTVTIMRWNSMVGQGAQVDDAVRFRWLLCESMPMLIVSRPPVSSAS
jgi:hypothetical protein